MVENCLIFGYGVKGVGIDDERTLITLDESLEGSAGGVVGAYARPTPMAEQLKRADMSEMTFS